MQDLDRMKQTCGSGWFVCKAYHDYIDNSYMVWDNDNSQQARESTYEKIINLGQNIVVDILQGIKNGSKDITYISKSKGKIPNAEILLMVDKLLDVFNSNVRKYFAEWKTPSTGYDENGYFIRYADNVEDNEKIPGLCCYLESEYEKILVFVRKLLGDRVCNYNRIPVVLCKELPKDIYFNDDNAIARMIKIKMKQNGNNISENEIKDILAKRQIENRVTGEYLNKTQNEPHIVIYYRNLNTTDLEEYNAQISQTLAHEFMHYVNNLIAGTGFNVNDIYSKDVKEAIADFFSVIYSIYSHNSDKKLMVAENSYNAWVKNFGSNWPYANALWFLLFDNRFVSFVSDYQIYKDKGIIERFVDVTMTSQLSLEKAYQKLID